MPAPIYTQPRLAALYDALNPAGPDTRFYLSLPGPPPQRILDVGCGTGMLACEFAALGHEVTGADPAAAMLAVARQRPGGDRVRWVAADAAGLALPDRFDLIVLTGHVFQLLISDEQIAAALRALARHLAPDGRLALETRNPADREWQFWSPAQTRQRVGTPAGPVEVHNDIVSVTGDLVTYETWYRFPDGETLVVPDTLRFPEQAELAAFLRDAGLAVMQWYGDWDRSPATPASPEIIAIARPAAPGARAVTAPVTGGDDGPMPDRNVPPPADRTPPRPDDEPVLPERSRDETDVGWGADASRDDDDEQLLRDRPPHWDNT